MSAGLAHVLWIGGAQGAGKSTAARAFAHRKGLRLYFVDAFTYSHAQRAETGPYPAMRAFEAKTMDERWLHPEPEEMADEFFEYSRNRFRMILEDLGALATEPGIVAEGPGWTRAGRPSWSRGRSSCRSSSRRFSRNPSLRFGSCRRRGSSAGSST